MDERTQTAEPARQDVLKTGLSFLSENPEAFGMVPDACPAATRDFLVAANGYTAGNGAMSPTHLVEEGGADGLLDHIYAGLLSRTDEHAALLRLTFGSAPGEQEHLIARYAAVLAEAEALDVLRHAKASECCETTGRIMGERISDKLNSLYEIIRRTGRLPSERSEMFFSVSLGACRIRAIEEDTPAQWGSYAVDIFAAGDFSVYLLDEEGMSPLWQKKTPTVGLDQSDVAVSDTVVITHRGPFAVLLLSESVKALNAAERRGLAESPGLIWRYRMRLEDTFQSLIGNCLREQDFGPRAARYFTGRAPDSDSASGAVAFRFCGGSFGAFREACQERHARLENMISLLPSGYDPTREVVLSDRAAVEKSYLLHLFDTSPDLVNRTAEAVRRYVIRKRQDGADAPVPDVPAGEPDAERISYEDVYRVFRVYDTDNDPDRALIRENTRALRESIAGQWVTIRPYLSRVMPAEEFLSAPSVHDGENDEHMAVIAHRRRADRSYAECVTMNHRLSAWIRKRKEDLDRMETALSDRLTALRENREDWMCGRAGYNTLAAWTEQFTDTIPTAVQPFLQNWQAETEAYTSLLTAYTAEREFLFEQDILPGKGQWAGDFQRICNGTLPEERWDEYRECLIEGAAGSDYMNLLAALRAVSAHTFELSQRIEARAAERHMAQEFAERDDCRMACLRASAYEDPDWGESTRLVMDETTRAEYRAMILNYLSEVELVTNRRETYQAYRAMYYAYSKPERP